MTITQATLILQLVNMGIDTALKAQYVINKVAKMSDEEIQPYIDNEHLRTKLLMDRVDSI